MTRVCICGGGSLGHVCAGVLASRDDVEVSIFTGQPQRWSDSIIVKDCNGKEYVGSIKSVSSDPVIASTCDIVFLCLPGYAIEETLTVLKPYVSSKIVGSIVCSTGFFYAAHNILGDSTSLFGFQRSPFIGRTAIYGRSANLLGYKSQVSIAVENIVDVELFRKLVETLWSTPTKILNNFFEASLTNSNPILHTGRLYSMWKGWKGAAFEQEILFYREWNDEASEIILNMDKEFHDLLERLPVADDAIPSLLDYYDSSNIQDLTNKIKSIPAFASIKAPMCQTAEGWIPDLNSRYFTEDFPYGLRFIYELSREKDVKTPTIDAVYQWGMSLINSR